MAGHQWCVVRASRRFVAPDTQTSSTAGIPFSSSSVRTLAFGEGPMSDFRLLEDVQEQRADVHVSLSRVGVTNVEKVIRIGANGTERLYWAKLDCFVDLGPLPEGRAHVALRGGRQRRDRRGRALRAGLPGRDARDAHRREGPRPPGRAPRRGAARGALPGAQAGARLGHRDAGALHAARHGRRLRGRHAAADRRPRPGHDRVPVRAGAGPGERARAAAGRRLRRRRDRADLRGRPRRHPQPARPRHAADRLPGGLRHRHRRRAAARDRRGLDVLGDLRADEALRRGRRGREGPPPPALRRGLRARVGPRGHRGLPGAHRAPLRLRAPGEPGDDPPAQRGRRALRPARRDPPRGGLTRGPRAAAAVPVPRVVLRLRRHAAQRAAHRRDRGLRAGLLRPAPIAQRGPARARVRRPLRRGAAARGARRRAGGAARRPPARHAAPGRGVRYDVAANWKAIVQNYSECLHCPGVHPELNRLTHYLSGVDHEGPATGAAAR